MSQMWHLSPHCCSLPMSRRRSITCLLLCRSTKGTPSLKQEQRLAALVLPIAETISVIRAKLYKLHPATGTKHPLYANPLPSLLHPPVFLSKKAFLLACAHTNVRLDFLVVGVAVGLEFWWMESEQKSGYDVLIFPNEGLLSPSHVFSSL